MGYLKNRNQGHAACIYRRGGTEMFKICARHIRLVPKMTIAISRIADACESSARCEANYLLAKLLAINVQSPNFSVASIWLRGCCI